MKRILTSLAILLSLLLPMAVTAYASADVNIVPQCGTSLKKTSFCSDVTGAKSGTASDPIIKIVKVVIEIVSFVAGVAAVVLIIISGIKFVTSGGDPAKVSSAKGSLISALIGIVIIILAQTIIVFVLDKVN